MHRPVITLTTDFGLKDPFVGIMKGVILGINPEVHIIDISHNIERHNILQASQTIFMSYRYFPKETIHVVVVDPGVGSGRRPILITTDDYFFIGPDNGIFTPICEETDSLTVIHLNATHYFLPMKGSTFHGRDIFAPVAAYLSKGVESLKLGEEIKDYVKIPSIKSTIEDNMTIRGNVVTIDIFGNAITNITRDELERISAISRMDKTKILFRDMEIEMVDYYEQARASMPYALINSFGQLELFVYKGDAARSFNIKIGDSVRVKLIE